MLTPGDLLEPFSAFSFDPSPVVVAVSGGSDSMALLLLLKTYLDGISPAPAIVAVTIDHGLRPGSTDEARAVEAFAGGLGVAHRTVKWEGDKPVAGLAAAARLARYRLLAEIAREIGAKMIVTGHTADDQAETIAMRASRGAGLGLAGMAPATLFDGNVWVVRPLLGVRRNALRAYLVGRQIGWIDDPTNSDAHYERVRMRSELADCFERVDDLLDTAKRNADRRTRLGMQAARLIEEHVRLAAPGLFHIGPAFPATDEQEGAVHALRILLAVAGGSEQLVNEDRTRRLLTKLARPPHRATLSRALVASRRDGIWITREARGLPDPAPATTGMVWDGRFKISCSAANCERPTIHAAGISDASRLEPDTELPRSLARAALAARPMLEDSIKSGAVSTEEQRNLKAPVEPSDWTASPILPPWMFFLPSFDLAPARAVADLIGATCPPDPPFADHIVRPA